MKLANEHSLQVSVLELLRLAAKRDLYWFAVPNAGKRSLRIGARMKGEGLRAGIADLCIMLPEGRACWLELKMPRNYQTPEQKAFQAVCQWLGHPYAVAKSLDQAKSILQQWEVLR